MRTLLLAAASSLAVVGSAIAGAIPPGGSADMTAGTNGPGNAHPGYTYNRPPKVTDPVPHEAVSELRTLAIKDFGQATSSKPADKGASDEAETASASGKAAPAGVKTHREAFWSRVEKRDESVPDT